MLACLGQEIYEDTKVSEGEGREGDPDTRAEIPLQSLLKTTMCLSLPLQPKGAHGTVELIGPAVCGGFLAQSKGMPKGC